MTKQCSKCGAVQPLSEFSKDKQKTSGFCSACKTCSKSLSTKQYLQRIGSDAKKNADRKGLSVSDATAYAKIYRKENKEKIAMHQKNYRTSSKNVPKLREKGMRRYVKQKNQTLSLLNEAFKAEMEGLYLFCQIFKGFQVDHILPICGEKVSGLHVPWNLQVITAEQNREKGNNFNPDRYPEQGAVIY